VVLDKGNIVEECLGWTLEGGCGVHARGWLRGQIGEQHYTYTFKVDGEETDRHGEERHGFN